MKRFVFLFLLGAIGYGLIELAWRGHTHWSMLIVGGICLNLIDYTARTFNGANILVIALLCSAVITIIEFISGAFLNIILGMTVWDYSALRFNLMGQISARYSLLWFFLSIPIIFLIRAYTFNEKSKSKANNAE